MENEEVVTRGRQYTYLRILQGPRSKEYQIVMDLPEQVEWILSRHEDLAEAQKEFEKVLTSKSRINFRKEKE